jgi:uncharacterized protein (DUF1778 family)
MSYIVRLAAKQTQANVSAFLVESACIRAEETLASQRALVYTPAQWKAFTQALERPAENKPRLRALLTEPSVLEQRQVAELSEVELLTRAHRTSEFDCGMSR